MYRFSWPKQSRLACFLCTLRWAALRSYALRLPGAERLRMFSLMCIRTCCIPVYASHKMQFATRHKLEGLNKLFCLLQLMDALAELPADLLLFHVCLPLTLPYLNIRCAAEQYMPGLAVSVTLCMLCCRTSLLRVSMPGMRAAGLWSGEGCSGGWPRQLPCWAWRTTCCVARDNLRKSRCPLQCTLLPPPHDTLRRRLATRAYACLLPLMQQQDLQ